MNRTPFSALASTSRSSSQDPEDLTGDRRPEHRVRVREAVDEPLAGRHHGVEHAPARGRERRTASSRRSSPWQPPGCPAERPSGRARTSDRSGRSPSSPRPRSAERRAGGTPRRSPASSRRAGRPPRAWRRRSARPGRRPRVPGRPPRIASSSSRASASPSPSACASGSAARYGYAADTCRNRPSHGSYGARRAACRPRRARRGCCRGSCRSARDEHIAVGFAAGQVVDAGQLQRRLDRLGSAGHGVDRRLVDGQHVADLGRIGLERLGGERRTVGIG